RRVRRGDAAGRFWNSICRLGAVWPVVAGPTAIVEPRCPSVWTADRGSGNRGIAPGHALEPAKLGPLLELGPQGNRRSMRVRLARCLGGDATVWPVERPGGDAARHRWKHGRQPRLVWRQPVVQLPEQPRAAARPWI